MIARTNEGKIDYKKIIIESGLYLVLFCMLIAIIIKEPTFLSLRNFKNILTQSSVRTIIALGVAGLIVTQGTDLSAGRQVGLSAVISGTLLQSMTNVNKAFPKLGEFSIFTTILIVVVVGVVIASINGVVVATLNVHPFIATMGTMTIVYGINSLYYDKAGAAPISGFVEKYSKFAQGYIKIGSYTIPYLIIYAAIATLIMWTLWNKTKFGKNVFAVGGNPEAAKVSGVNVVLTLMGIYALSGAYYAFGGFLRSWAYRFCN